jgi:hypothetical protein
MTDWTQEARELLVDYGFLFPARYSETVSSLATALAAVDAAAYERGKMEERERCAVLCEETAMTSPYGNLRPTHDIYLPEPSHHKEDKSHHTGMGYAALLRNQL